MITGYGIMKEANGNVYEGNLLNNAYSGAGMMVYKNGDKYLGYFVNNRRESSCIKNIIKRNIRRYILAIENQMIG